MTNLHETLNKFTKGKNLDFILSSQRPSLNKNALGFKPNRTPSKGLNKKKKMNCRVYKCSRCKKLGHFEPFYFDTFKSYEGKNLKPSGKTNAPEPKKIWVPKVKP